MATGTTTIQVSKDIKKLLDEMKLSARETYNDVLKRVLVDDHELSEQTKRDIQKSLAEFRAGKFKTLEQYRKERGI